MSIKTGLDLKKMKGKKANIYNPINMIIRTYFVRIIRERYQSCEKGGKIRYVQLPVNMRVPH